jgi:hypothetical protein
MTNDHSIRLMAARVLDDGPYKHDKTYYRCNLHGTHVDCKCMCPSKCEKCGADGVLGDSPCPIPSLSTEPLEVLAWKCKDASDRQEWGRQLWDLLLIDHSEGKELNVRPAHWIQAAARAKGIVI